LRYVKATHFAVIYIYIEQRIADLEAENASLREQNEGLQAVVSKLMNELNELKKFMRNHK
jgi:cell division protein FtsB